MPEDEDVEDKDITLLLNRGDNFSVSSTFVSKQFDCRCNLRSCKSTELDPTLPEALEKLIELAGPIRINSAYRCPEWNRRVGGTGGSYHLLGKAADIQSDKYTGKELANFAMMVEEFEQGGIGVSENWIHVDVRGFKSRWAYPPLS